ncbi:virulence RhuM family protein [Candidatus Saccharibacteria bacterium]|nr:virulence RhuM family protein [Candidatus Saccharibacteria bacterium]
MSSKNQEPTDNQENIIFYQSDDGLVKIKTTLNNETIWLSLDQIAELFEKDKSNISRHLKNIFAEGELDKNSTVAFFATVQKEGNREVKRQIEYYNLDAIISVGYRTNSARATAFRIWATKVLKEYIVKGFALDDDRLKNRAGGDYWKELLGRIRDIRSSEKMLYRQVLDLYATSVDYDPKSKESIKFFKIVQNKLHYATHGHTAAEVIYERADAKKPFMGLTTFSGKFPTLSDAKIAKNYLNESELKVLNNLVSGYFDLAEISAIEHKPMYMKDYIEKLNTILSSSGRELLNDAGKITREKALEKATKEYRKFELENPSPVEEAYLKSLTSLEKQVKKKTK